MKIKKSTIILITVVVISIACFVAYHLLKRQAIENYQAPDNSRARQRSNK